MGRWQTEMEELDGRDVQISTVKDFFGSTDEMRWKVLRPHEGGLELDPGIYKGYERIFVNTDSGVVVAVWKEKADD